MSKKIRKLDYDQILKILREYDKESVYEKVNVIPSSDDLHEQMSEYINLPSFSKVAVLGIDIYRYGQYRHLEQTLIPSLFKILFDKAIRLCLENNQFVFQYYDKEAIEKAYINTGDGGFLIFDTPIHAMFFGINFEMVVRAYNAYHLFPKLRNIIGSISLRYAITRDTIFQGQDNYFGSAIINNARILERDTLNRCLIDQNTYDWFMTNIDGIENLQVYTIDRIANVYEFLTYDRKYIDEGVNEILRKEVTREAGIINSDVSKIGQILSKDSTLNIYNLHVQVTTKIFADDNIGAQRIITISLGNLNTAGI
jgi:hypothetical protein